jgi:hypothetical protein
MTAPIQQIADDLQAILDGSLGPEEFRARHPISGQTGRIEQVLCVVEHYLADGDIRRKDSGYRDMQDTEMQKLISCLRSGRIGDALKINFLGHSG